MTDPTILNETDMQLALVIIDVQRGKIAVTTPIRRVRAILSERPGEAKRPNAT